MISELGATARPGVLAGTGPNATGEDDEADDDGGNPSGMEDRVAELDAVLEVSDRDMGCTDCVVGGGAASLLDFGRAVVCVTEVGIEGLETAKGDNDAGDRRCSSAF